MDGEDVSQSNANKVLPLEVERVLSKDTVLPGTTIDVQIILKNTTPHPIESLYIIEGDIQPANEIELFPVTETDSLIFINQGIITVGKQHKFHYSISLHPYSSSEHIAIADMQVSFSANGIPFQMTVPGTTIAVGSIPIEDLEISEGYYTCPKCGNHLEFDTVLCTNCGFQINQETLQRIWTTHQSHEKLIEEELIQTDEKSVQIEESVKTEEELIPIEAERNHAEEISAQMEEPAKAEENIVQAELPAQIEIMYLKQAAQAFREEKFEDCLLNLKITLQIITHADPALLQNANGVIEKLLANIMAYDGKPVSKRTATTSLKFTINFVKSLKTKVSESPH